MGLGQSLQEGFWGLQVVSGRAFLDALNTGTSQPGKAVLTAQSQQQGIKSLHYLVGHWVSWSIVAFPNT